MDAPKYEAPPEDPAIKALRDRAENDNTRAAQETAGIDTSALMARYGTRLAMAGTTAGSPLAVVPPPVFGKL